MRKKFFSAAIGYRIARSGDASHSDDEPPNGCNAGKRITVVKHAAGRSTQTGNRPQKVAFEGFPSSPKSRILRLPWHQKSK